MLRINATRRPTPTAQGVTLIELLISVALLGAIAVFSVQSYGSLMVKMQKSTQANLFIAALHNARAEAINRRERVTLCRANTNYDGCVTDANTWEKGWIMFVDSDRDGELDGGETTLQTQAAFQGKNRLVAATGDTDFVNFISYTHSGYARGAGTGTAVLSGALYVCGKIRVGLSASDSKIGTEILIPATGTPRATELDIGAAALSNCP
jgi:type IV fimbrial biogenesis protein FimT